MTTEDDLVRLLHGHASRAPDADQVLARIHAGVARRRRHAQLGAAGGAGLAVVGLVVGVQALAPGGERQDVGPAAPPSVTEPAEPPVTTAPADPVEPTEVVVADGGRAALTQMTFLTAGYTGLDAAELGELWRLEDTQLVKVLAGAHLEAGEPLPIDPGEQVTAPAQDLSQEVLAGQAFSQAGYTLDDAAEIAALWNEQDPYLAKALAGQQILLGQDLPVSPR